MGRRSLAWESNSPRPARHGLMGIAAAGAATRGFEYGLTEAGGRRIARVYAQIARVGPPLERRETEERQESDEGDNDREHRLHLLGFGTVH
jgi:hypothetical protein